MRILVIGGDGYLGWPTAKYFSQKGHDVAVADNFARRRADAEFGTDTLIPISSLQERVRVWRETTGRTIEPFVGDVTNYAFVERLFSAVAPEAIVHFGELRSAPYSMIDREHAVLTQMNNVSGTLNILYAIAERNLSCHLVKLGTMGEYGTPNIDIEEGEIEIQHKGRSDVLPYPMQPGSFYHLSKLHDSNNIRFACRTWGIRATDLHQGVVYGVQTEGTEMDPRLDTRFDYDGIWGTALNRFCVQAVLAMPLTVYGSGGQTRGYLDIRDTLACIELALLNPAESGEFRVFNQFTEQFSVLQLAEMVQGSAAELGMQVEIQNIENPRVEKEEHYFNAKHTKLLDLGLEPHFLSETLIGSVFKEVERHIDRAQVETIMPWVNWRSTRSAQPAWWSGAVGAERSR